MFRAIRNLVSKPRTAARRPRTQLGVDRLPDRINPVITDMTGMSNYFPTHDGPTTLYLSFDGCDNLYGHSVAPFTGSTKDKADILYRVSEEFAPFNVQVRQDFGFGNYGGGNGSTTVFVGDDRGFDQTLTRPDGSLIGVLNQKGAITPGPFMDTPYKNKQDHAPNSDPFDLAFVDPVEQSRPGVPTSNAANTWISRAICHETGHTLGLAHVLGKPTNDVMSYDSSNDFFANKDLPVTTLNYNPSTGSTDPDDSMQPVFTDPNDGVQANITTQNSYTYLASMLDWRPAHQPRVAHHELVDSSVYKNFSGTYGTSFTRDVDLGPADYRVYHIQPGANATAVDVHITNTSGEIPPMALVYRSGGGVEFYDSKYLGNGKFELKARLDVTDGNAFDLVVGGFGGNEAGRLHVEVSRPLGSLSNNTAYIVGSPAGSFGTVGILSSTVGRVVGTPTGTVLSYFGSGSATLDAPVWEFVYSAPPSMLSAKLTTPADYAPLASTDPVTSDVLLPTDQPAPVDQPTEPVVDQPSTDATAPVDQTTEPVAEDPAVVSDPTPEEPAVEQSSQSELVIDDPTMVESIITDAAASETPPADAALESDVPPADGASVEAVSPDAGGGGVTDTPDPRNTNEPSVELPPEPTAVPAADASADPLLHPNG